MENEYKNIKEEQRNIRRKSKEIERKEKALEREKKRWGLMNYKIHKEEQTYLENELIRKNSTENLSERKINNLARDNLDYWKGILGEKYMKKDEKSIFYWNDLKMVPSLVLNEENELAKGIVSCFTNIDTWNKKDKPRYKFDKRENLLYAGRGSLDGDRYESKSLSFEPNVSLAIALSSIGDSKKANQVMEALEKKLVEVKYDSFREWLSTDKLSKEEAKEKLKDIISEKKKEGARKIKIFKDDENIRVEGIFPKKIEKFDIFQYKPKISLDDCYFSDYSGGYSSRLLNFILAKNYLGQEKEAEILFKNRTNFQYFNLRHDLESSCLDLILSGKFEKEEKAQKNVEKEIELLSLPKWNLFKGYSSQGSNLSDLSLSPQINIAYLKLHQGKYDEAKEIIKASLNAGLNKKEHFNALGMIVLEGLKNPEKLEKIYPL